ncbi:MAG: hypothetical protein AVDCRST_MAG56-6882 [uncultured Cytophagales bacterium]|uniref:Uncharacterized protein n=1 Tax=uncultured Cytophagales bacterium TaxID=158755 RepID=A0A6J4L1X4_9SPHI|nr:MAG: hypothetical protein AVDCRST_MAG56-6882 [uncultured Cytophagales bacterium]
MQAEMEKPRRGSVASRCLTMVVFPEPEGAEKMIALPLKGAGELIRY